MSEPTPVDRMREVLLAEREVIEAAEKWASSVPGPNDPSHDALLEAVDKLREVRSK